MSEQVPEKGNQGNKGGANRGQDRAAEVHARNAARPRDDGSMGTEGTPGDVPDVQQQETPDNADVNGNSVDADGDGVHDGPK